MGMEEKLMSTVTETVDSVKNEVTQIVEDTKATIEGVIEEVKAQMSKLTEMWKKCRVNWQLSGHWFHALLAAAVAVSRDPAKTRMMREKLRKKRLKKKKKPRRAYNKTLLIHEIF